MSAIDVISSVVDLVITTGEKIASNKKIKKAVCGKYSDGRARSLLDAIDGEILSPRQKAKFEKDSHKKKKRKRTKFML